MFKQAFGKVGAGAMDILLLVGGLLATLIYVGWSCARSYYNRGRLRGAEEATREVLRGLGAHYELEGQKIPETIAKALKSISAVSDKRYDTVKAFNDAYHPQLWVLGDAVGEACWLKGHSAGMKRKAPAEGKIRVDLSLNELLQLSWLAHLGFQNMMPNYRCFEIHRFSHGEDAQEAAKAVSRIECAIPSKLRPFADPSIQLKNRQQLICDWWPSTPHRLTA
jgi:hypothetical protein